MTSALQRSSLIVRFGHEGMGVELATTAVFITIRLLTSFAPSAAVALLFTWFAVLGSFAYAFRAHSMSLCMRCAHQTPLDAGAEVYRHGWWLWWQHRENWVVAALGTQLVLILVFMALPLGVPSLVCGMVVMLLAYANAVGRERHRVLRPWCVWCHADDGGGGGWSAERFPHPDPAGNWQR